MSVEKTQDTAEQVKAPQANCLVQSTVQQRQWFLLYQYYNYK